MSRRHVSSSEESEDGLDELRALRQAKAKRSKRKAADAESNSETEQQQAASYETPKSKLKKRAKMSATRVEDESAPEAEEEATFQYKYDSEMYGDAEDRAYLLGLPEVKREAELTRRFEEYERARSRWETKRNMMARQREARRKARAAEVAAAAAADGGEEEEEEGSGRRRRSSSQATKASRAMAKLKAKREKATRRASARDEEDNYEEPPTLPTSESEEEEEEEWDGAAAFDGRIGGASGGRRRHTMDEGGEEMGDEEAYEQRDEREAFLNDLLRCRLSRHKLERWCHETFFRDLIRGCFVRIGIGAFDGNQVYRCAKVVGVKEGRVYRLGRTKTDLALVLAYGAQERTFRMEFVSNQPFTASEYEGWRKETVDSAMPLTTMYEVEKKENAIRDAVSHKHSYEETKKIIETKRRLGIAPTNFASQKEALKRRLLVASGQNSEEAEALREELQELEAKEVAFVAKTQASLRGITSINQRNRAQNVVHDAADFVPDTLSRRVTAPKSIVADKAGGGDGDKNEEEEKSGEKGGVGGSGGGLGGGDKKLDARAGLSSSSSSSPKIKVRDRRSSEAIDDLHSFSISIPEAPVLAKARTPIVPTVTPSGSSSSSSSSKIRPVSRGPPSRLNLGAYKKRLGLL